MESLTTSTGHSSRKVKKRITSGREVVWVHGFLGPAEIRTENVSTLSRVLFWEVGSSKGGTLSVLELKKLKYKEVKWHIQVKLPISSQRDGAICLSLSGSSGQAGINSFQRLVSSQEPKVKLIQPQQRTKYTKLPYQYLESTNNGQTPYDPLAMNLKA